jgi:RNA polymerase sigma-70 factor (ECF subfamily)
VSENRPAPTGPLEVDRQLALRLQARDGAALSELYDRFGRIVYSLALRIVKVPGDAEEVTQEVFLYAWEKAGLFDTSRGGLVTWLGTLARSRSIDRLRQQKSQERRKEAVARDPVGGRPAASPDLEASLNERSALIRSALSGLPADQREAIEIAYFEGLSQSEIAARLKTPLGTIKTRIRQGMIRLKSAIGPVLNMEPE